MESCFWAEFVEIGNDIFRFDTRIYLNSITSIESSDRCIGAVVGKNPGSAKPTKKIVGLQPINLDGDKLLPTVKNIVTNSYYRAGIDYPKRSYIQILNLFYLCEPQFNQAILKHNNNKSVRFCSTEKSSFPWVWYVWGEKLDNLNIYKIRFSNLQSNVHFYYDQKLKEVVDKQPSISDFAKHTQGLKHDYMIPYIANILQNSTT